MIIYCLLNEENAKFLAVIAGNYDTHTDFCNVVMLKFLKILFWLSPIVLYSGTRGGGAKPVTQYFILLSCSSSISY